MENISFRNSRGLSLAGNFYAADSGTAIVMCHGFTGDKSEWGRFDKAAYRFNEAGYNVLNFDFSGSGESDDDSLSVGKQVDDLECAIKYVHGKGVNKIGLLGLSLGALVSAKVYDEQISTVVFWAPVTDKVHYEWDKRYNAEQLQELDEKGCLTITRGKGVRKTYIVDKQMLKDRSEIDQQSLLSRIKCPVLIIHGNKDDRVPLEDSRNAIKYLSNDSRLKIVKGADHHFNEQLDEFIALSVEWFGKHL